MHMPSSGTNASALLSRSQPARPNPRALACLPRTRPQAQQGRLLQVQQHQQEKQQAAAREGELRQQEQACEPQQEEQEEGGSPGPSSIPRQKPPSVQPAEDPAFRQAAFEKAKRLCEELQRESPRARASAAAEQETAPASAAAAATVVAGVSPAEARQTSGVRAKCLAQPRARRKSEAQLGTLMASRGAAAAQAAAAAAAHVSAAALQRTASDPADAAAARWQRSSRQQAPARVASTTDGEVIGDAQPHRRRQRRSDHSNPGSTHTSWGGDSGSTGTAAGPSASGEGGVAAKGSAVVGAGSGVAAAADAAGSMQPPRTAPRRRLSAVGSGNLQDASAPPSAGETFAAAALPASDAGRAAAELVAATTALSACAIATAGPAATEAAAGNVSLADDGLSTAGLPDRTAASNLEEEEEEEEEAGAAGGLAVGALRLRAPPLPGSFSALTEIGCDRAEIVDMGSPVVALPLSPTLDSASADGGIGGYGGPVGPAGPAAAAVAAGTVLQPQSPMGPTLSSRQQQQHQQQQQQQQQQQPAYFLGGLVISTQTQLATGAGWDFTTTGPSGPSGRSLPQPLGGGPLLLSPRQHTRDSASSLAHSWADGQQLALPPAAFTAAAAGRPLQSGGGSDGLGHLLLHGHSSAAATAGIGSWSLGGGSSVSGTDNASDTSSHDLRLAMAAALATSDSALLMHGGSGGLGSIKPAMHLQQQHQQPQQPQPLNMQSKQWREPQQELEHADAGATPSAAAKRNRQEFSLQQQQQEGRPIRRPSHDMPHLSLQRFEFEQLHAGPPQGRVALSAAAAAAKPTTTSLWGQQQPRPLSGLHAAASVPETFFTGQLPMYTSLPLQQQAAGGMPPLLLPSPVARVISFPSTAQQRPHMTRPYMPQPPAAPPQQQQQLASQQPHQQLVSLLAAAQNSAGAGVAGGDAAAITAAAAAAAVSRATSSQGGSSFAFHMGAVPGAGGFQPMALGHSVGLTAASADRLLHSSAPPVLLAAAGGLSPAMASHSPMAVQPRVSVIAIRSAGLAAAPAMGPVGSAPVNQLQQRLYDDGLRHPAMTDASCVMGLNSEDIDTLLG